MIAALVVIVALLVAIRVAFVAASRAPERPEGPSHDDWWGMSTGRGTPAPEAGSTPLTGAGLRPSVQSVRGDRPPPS